MAKRLCDLSREPTQMGDQMKLVIIFNLRVASLRVKRVLLPECWRVLEGDNP